MKQYIRLMNPELSERVTLAKARFGDIKRALQYGAAYSFDEEAYGRFYPPARKAGICAGREDFSGETPAGLHFVRVQLMRTSRN